MKKMHLKLMMCLIVYVVLTAVSVISTTAQLQSDTRNMLTTKSLSDNQYLQLINEIKNQQNILDALISSANQDIKEGYRTRGQKILSTLVLEERTKLDTLKKRVKDAQALLVPQTPLSEFIQVFASTFRLDEENLHGQFCFGLGLLLDFCCAFLLLMGVKGQDEMVCITSVKEIDPVIDKAIGTTQVPEAKEYGMSHINIESSQLNMEVEECPPEIIDFEYQRIKQLIITKEHPPIVRLLKKHEHIGTKKAIRYFKMLEKDGVLRKESNRYVLAA